MNSAGIQTRVFIPSHYPSHRSHIQANRRCHPQAVTRLDTDQTQCRLTSLIGRERMFQYDMAVSIKKFLKRNKNQEVVVNRDLLEGKGIQKKKDNS